MTVADVVARTMDDRLEDFVREAVALVARELMEAEVSSEIGAGLGEVAPESRSTHRNGYRPRAWERGSGVAAGPEEASGRAASQPARCASPVFWLSQRDRFQRAPNSTRPQPHKPAPDLTRACERTSPSRRW